MLESLRHLIEAIYNVRGLIEWGGTILVCAIIFMETGLFAGFFLPGDSLLVTAGIFAAAGHLRLVWLVVLVPLCAIAGDQLGYFVGWKAGRTLYSRPNSRFFKREHLEQAHQFYDRYGGKAIILARFVPIARTFCPAVAGAARMAYRKFFAYDVCGGLLWVLTAILGGYFLGSVVPNIEHKVQWVILIVVFLSLLPPAIHLLRRRRAKAAGALPGT
ncbi:MAG TPA: VTT domain-containing protein [Candidatus Dormibacteraeota bacterium]|nr:VTT domain-containing protein [Candidatus Dormibacteraeota bacterium]